MKPQPAACRNPQHKKSKNREASLFSPRVVEQETIDGKNGVAKSQHNYASIGFELPGRRLLWIILTCLTLYNVNYSSSSEVEVTRLSFVLNSLLSSRCVN